MLPGIPPSYLRLLSTLLYAQPTIATPLGEHLFKTGEVNSAQGQQPLIQDGVFRTPILDIGVYHVVTIGMGHPSQPIQVVLDIQEPRLFLQSALCTTELCTHSPHPGFDEAASDSFVSSQQAYRLAFSGAWFIGNISDDTLAIGGVDIPHQSFLDAREVTLVAWYAIYGGFDGVLGLAPGTEDTNPQFPSPWRTLVSGERLHRNIFSIVLPSRFSGDGELILGDVSDGFDEEASTQLKLVEAEDRAWVTSLESMSFGEEDEKFEDATVLFQLDSPMVLPSRWAQAIVDTVGMPFDCEKRKDLPVLKLGMGGTEVRLDGFDYSVEMEEPGGEKSVCVVPVRPSDDWGDGLSTVILGRTFLERFRVVFAPEESLIMLERL
ncbi:aspartic peptidase domain-containing protein [Massariosphaeria phaeospora]|uniref:Aspartic peptidase domain-containing protein n=1 Tax=Massariosphaeria phaeospora TaxID=100035 RepID=A0A7C8I2A3_9PLEO|nr:aspartic peptidase domain-containing protein [Massariosphaeria phaeospora]